MATNKEIAEAFAAHFRPPLQVVETLNINNIPTPGAYTCSYFDRDKQIGVMAVVHNGVIKAYIESAGKGRHSADRAGSVLSDVLASFPELADAANNNRVRSREMAKARLEGGDMIKAADVVDGKLALETASKEVTDAFGKLAELVFEAVKDAEPLGEPGSIDNPAGMR